MNIYVCETFDLRMVVYIYCHCRRHLNVHLHSITRRFLSDVQTDVQFVRVDSDSPIRKLAETLIYQSKWCTSWAPIRKWIQSYQYLSILPHIVNCQNLTCNLALTEDHGAVLLEPFPSQIWISDRGWGLMSGKGAAVLNLGSEVGVVKRRLGDLK